MIQKIENCGKVLSIVIRANYQKSGIEFLTPPEFSQQLAYMGRQKGYVIAPHVHNLVQREVYFTEEVLYIKSGRVRVDFYDDEKRYLKSTILNRGDVILLAGGGHGFEMIEDSEIIEVKQGPYAGEHDKVRFDPIGHDKLEIDK